MPQEEIPDVKALQEQLQQTQLAYQMAAQMSQFKGGFLGRVAHELRSPLSSAIGLHQLILSDLCEDRDEEREFIAQAHASALKLVKLLDEVIAVSKIAHGSNKLEIQPLNLSAVLEEVYSLLHAIAANRSLRLRLEPPESPIYISADAKCLRQVLTNLVDAAIAGMKEGSIKISAASFPEAQEARICIDAQCPPATWSEPVDLLRAPIEAEAKSAANAELSPGLNLVAAQMLVAAMGGRLEIAAADSAEAENWTRVQCSLPLAAPDRQ